MICFLQPRGSQREEAAPAMTRVWGAQRSLAITKTLPGPVELIASLLRVIAALQRKWITRRIQRGGILVVKLMLRYPRDMEQIWAATGLMTSWDLQGFSNHGLSQSRHLMNEYWTELKTLFPQLHRFIQSKSLFPIILGNNKWSQFIFLDNWW